MAAVELPLPLLVFFALLPPACSATRPSSPLPFFALLSVAAFFLCPDCDDVRRDEEADGDGSDDVEDGWDEPDESTSEPSMDESDSLLLLSLPLSAAAAERRRCRLLDIARSEVKARQSQRDREDDSQQTTRRGQQEAKVGVDRGEEDRESREERDSKQQKVTGSSQLTVNRASTNSSHARTREGGKIRVN